MGNLLEELSCVRLLNIVYFFVGVLWFQKGFT
jgi:hypothetical protein